MFIYTLSGPISITSFFPRRLFGNVNLGVYTYNIFLASPLLLQPILANTLCLIRQLAQGRNDTARKRVNVKHHVKESFESMVC